MADLRFRVSLRDPDDDEYEVREYAIAESRCRTADEVIRALSDRITAEGSYTLFDEDSIEEAEPGESVDFVATVFQVRPYELPGGNCPFCGESDDHALREVTSSRSGALLACPRCGMKYRVP